MKSFQEINEIFHRIKDFLKCIWKNEASYSQAMWNRKDETEDIPKCNSKTVYGATATNTILNNIKYLQPKMDAHN